ncbi:hypothetical protein T484DRAFT_1845225, partial [Baffinella frigidus]
ARSTAWIDGVFEDVWQLSLTIPDEATAVLINPLRKVVVSQPDVETVASSQLLLEVIECAVFNHFDQWYRYSSAGPDARKYSNGPGTVFSAVYVNLKRILMGCVARIFGADMGIERTLEVRKLQRLCGNDTELDQFFFEWVKFLSDSTSADGMRCLKVFAVMLKTETITAELKSKRTAAFEGMLDDMITAISDAPRHQQPTKIRELEEKLGTDVRFLAHVENKIANALLPGAASGVHYAAHTARILQLMIMSAKKWPVDAAVCSRVGEVEELGIRVEAVAEYWRRTGMPATGVTTRLQAEWDCIVRGREDRARALKKAKAMQEAVSKERRERERVRYALPVGAAIRVAALEGKTQEGVQLLQSRSAGLLRMACFTAWRIGVPFTGVEPFVRL